VRWAGVCVTRARRNNGGLPWAWGEERGAMLSRPEPGRVFHPGERGPRKHANGERPPGAALALRMLSRPSRPRRPPFPRQAAKAWHPAHNQSRFRNMGHDPPALPASFGKLEILEEALPDLLAEHAAFVAVGGAFDLEAGRAAQVGQAAPAIFRELEAYP